MTNGTGSGGAPLRVRLLLLSATNAFHVVLLGVLGAVGLIVIGRENFGIPFLVAGFGGAAGAFVVTVSAWLAWAATGGGSAKAATGGGSAKAAGGGDRLRRAGRLCDVGRAMVLASAAAALVAGVAVALAGDDVLTDLALSVAAVVPTAVAAMSAGTVARVVRSVR